MQKRITFFIAVLFVTSTMAACVKQSTYQKRDAEAIALTQTVEELTNRINLLTRERDELLRKLELTSNELKSTSDELKSTSDKLRLTAAEADQKIAVLEGENLKLQADIAELQVKTEKVEAESNTYKELTREMKSELAKGEMTIKELKGKLTLDVVDRILFASGEAKVKEEGLEVLRRVVEILKNVKDRDIRIEGHTDNVKIKGMLAKVYPTNWELSAARAINVVHFLQEQGLEPILLSGAAFGEYKPLADNETEVGRARNRRIAIVLVPKD
jgi:chemotaxis protein MotB